MQTKLSNRFNIVFNRLLEGAAVKLDGEHEYYMTEDNGIGMKYFSNLEENQVNDFGMSFREFVNLVEAMKEEDIIELLAANTIMKCNKTKR